MVYPLLSIAITSLSSRNNLALMHNNRRTCTLLQLYLHIIEVSILVQCTYVIVIYCSNSSVVVLVDYVHDTSNSGRKYNIWRP